MHLVDTHAHFTFNDYADNLDDILSRSRQVGVTGWITVGTDLADSRAALQLSQKYENMYCTVGIHPHEADKQQEGYREELRAMAAEGKVRAIGEIGLDYHYDFSPREVQRKIFEEQLDLAGQMNKPVVVHCREAMTDCLAILDEWNREDIPVVFHCFSGGRDEARAVVERGYWVSFTGVITFRNAAEIREAVRCIPPEKILLETDCPYLSPEPKRKIRPNEPAFLVHTAAKLAELLEVSVEKIAQVTADNSRLFFKMEP